MKKVRESGIELLRIILMLQIIVLHIYDYGGYSKLIENNVLDTIENTDILNYIIVETNTIYLPTKTHSFIKFAKI